MLELWPGGSRWPQEGPCLRHGLEEGSRAEEEQEGKLLSSLQITLPLPHPQFMFPTLLLGPQPTQPLPWAGALPIGARAGRVHALVAATGVKAHLARPTLHAVFLTLIDVCGGWGGMAKDRRGGEKKEQRQRAEAQKAQDGFSGRAMPAEDPRGAAPVHLSPASLMRDSPADRP